MRILLLLALAGAILIIPPIPSADALHPGEILVVANRNARDSVALARYYMEKRGVPAENLLKIWTRREETISRRRYEREIERPVRKRVLASNGLIRCVLLVYGIPLRIAPEPRSRREEAELKALLEGEEALERRLDAAEAPRTKAGLQARIAEIRKEVRRLKKVETQASVDSELTLALLPDHPTRGWIPNPLFIGWRGKDTGIPPGKVILVARLDGPGPEVVRRLVDDALFAEAHGLNGTACFDARWPAPPPEKAKELTVGYRYYDLSIHRAADLVRASGLFKVKIDSKETLFGEGDCPNAALYVGWYSLARYVDAFDWVRGAVGYHIASAECTTLRARGSRVWCKSILEEGGAATIGPVAEPYVQAFPPPDLFFGLLLGTRLTLVECYMLSEPYLSWQMVLVGDPLYRPNFRRRSNSSPQENKKPDPELIERDHRKGE